MGGKRSKMSEHIYIDRYSELWDHTMMRIRNAESKATVNGKFNNEKFVTQMVTRLKRIEHIEKVHYAIAVLKATGHDDVVDIYEGRLLMEDFLKASGQGTFY